jgi:hypothetical protein
MIHAIINDMFTPGQAETHLALIRQHLRLVPRPPDGGWRMLDEVRSPQGDRRAGN